MQRPDNENDRVLTGCLLWAGSAILVTLGAAWLLYDFLATRLHW